MGKYSQTLLLTLSLVSGGSENVLPFPAAFPGTRRPHCMSCVSPQWVTCCPWWRVHYSVVHTGPQLVTNLVSSTVVLVLPYGHLWVNISGVLKLEMCLPPRRSRRFPQTAATQSVRALHALYTHQSLTPTRELSPLPLKKIFSRG